MKKKIVVTVAVFLLISLVPMPAFATSYTVSDGETFSISTVSDGDIITVDAGATATITGSKNVAIICGSGVHLTIENLIIDVSATTDLNALAFTGTDNTLTLVGASSFKSGEYQSGINVGGSTSLTINGTGSLSATGGYNGGAGIGGNVSESGGTITIAGGDITASGGVCGGAGIGGSRNGYGGITTISGGNVTAYGGPDSAGIGGGYGRNGGTISIENGTIVSTGGDGAAGIGGGINANGGNIYIYGGNVTASDTNGAGIGGGSNGSSGNITISGGTINASSVSGAGIGGGNSGNGDFIIIEGGTINTSSNMGAGIGGGKLSDGGYITISGGTISATSGDGGAGIGGGSQGDGGVITITGGTITAKNTENGAGIGGGAFASGGTIKISGGMVYAARGTNAPYDIGDGKIEVSGTLQISGTAIVFSKNNYCIPPSLGSGNVHKADYDAQYPLIFSSNSVYGITVDPSWTDAKGGYFALKILEYNINGGNGTTPDSVAIALGKSTTLSSSTGLSKTGYTFNGWNDGSATYAVGASYTINADMELVAQWLSNATPTPAPTAAPRRTSSTTNTPEPTPSPEPSATQAPAPSGEATASPAPTDTPIPKPTQTPPAYIITNVVSTDDGKTVINIDVTSLPQRTSAVKLPSGQVVPIGNAENGMLTIEVFDGWNNDNGSITLVMIGDDEVALGSYNIVIPQNVEKTAEQGFPIWVFFLVGAVIVFWIFFFVGKKIRKDFNSRNKRI